MGQSLVNDHIADAYNKNNADGDADGHCDDHSEDDDREDESGAGFCHRYYYNESFADIHKVAGLRGAFIASQLIAANGSFTVENQRSLITYDKGGEWELLNSPRELHGRPNTSCTKVSCVETRNSFILLFFYSFFFFFFNTSGRDTIIPP